MPKNSLAHTQRWDGLKKSAHQAFAILQNNDQLEAARRCIVAYLNQLYDAMLESNEKVPDWDFLVRREALRAMLAMFSRRNEKLTGNSPLKHLWNAARTGDAPVEDDFIVEFEHLFMALHGQARIYPGDLIRGLEEADFDSLHGQEAARRRSDFLDGMGDRMDEVLKSYPHGLLPEVDARRQENRRRILEVFGGTEDDWTNTQWHYRNVIRDRNGLERMRRVVNMSDEQARAIETAIDNGIPFGVTPHYLHLMDMEEKNRDMAVRQQVFPPASYVEAVLSHMSDRNLAFDFMREHDTSPEAHITRRYVKVAILKPYDTCPQICVYCQRNWEITSPFAENAEVSQHDLDRALQWVSEHSHIMDLLITGGDPLIMSNIKLKSLLDRLTAIPHLRTIRIASRFPVTLPQRIDDQLVDLLAGYHEPGRRIIYFVTHIQHPYEICRETLDAVNRLRKRGIGVYNQQVFTFANSRRFESVALRIILRLIGVDPYYVFNMKGKSEMENYAVPIARLLQERKEEARLLPGVFRTDEPVFNVPFLGKNHVRANQDHELISIMPDGRRVYAFHPWERNIRRVRSYVYRDVSIGAYLRNLEEMGESISDYRTIWYYY